MSNPLRGSTRAAATSAAQVTAKKKKEAAAFKAVKSTKQGEAAVQKMDEWTMAT